MRLDELRHRSAESAERETAALERHAPAAERDAKATRALAEAAGDLAAVPLGGFLPGGSKPVASAGGSPAGATAPRGETIGTGGGGAGGGFVTGANFLTSQGGAGRQGGVIRAEDWIAEHCIRKTFEVPNPQNSAAIAEKDFVKVPGWDCSGEYGVPPGTVVFYDPEAWDALQGAARLSKTTTGGSSGLQQGAGNARLGYNITNQVGDDATRTVSGPPPRVQPPPPFTPASQTVTTGASRRVEDLLAELVVTQKEALREVKTRPAGPSGSKGQRLV